MHTDNLTINRCNKTFDMVYTINTKHFAELLIEQFQARNYQEAVKTADYLIADTKELKKSIQLLRIQTQKEQSK